MAEIIENIPRQEQSPLSAPGTVAALEDSQSVGFPARPAELCVSQLSEDIGSAQPGVEEGVWELDDSPPAEVTHFSKADKEVFIWTFNILVSFKVINFSL